MQMISQGDDLFACCTACTTVDVVLHLYIIANPDHNVRSKKFDLIYSQLSNLPGSFITEYGFLRGWPPVLPSSA